MEQLIQLILQAGKTTIDLALYVLLPVLVIMMALMKLLEARGVVAGFSKILAPVFNRFGIPGMGVFAALQLLFVGFAAPIATLRLMETNGTSRRGIAATLAMVLAMSQANVVFPMAAIGLDVGGVILTSIIGGLVAASTTYYLFTRSLGADCITETLEVQRDSKTSTINLLIIGGQEAVDIVLKSIPIILIAIFLVNLIQYFGLIHLIETLTTPLFHLFGLSSNVVLPIVTKFMAGGTAMLGVSMQLVQDGTLDIGEINRLAGLMVNPLDIVGIALLISAGQKTASVVRPAIAG
ncbi:MAG: nucleoside recognition family protein, partial [Geopsychrobacter sp.]|nr:nucleoside recognition family protein [Geopsychrobacter sp.]